MRFIGLQPQQPAGKREVSGGLFLSFDFSYLLTLGAQRFLFKNHALTTGDAGKIPADVLVLGGLPKHPAVGSLTD